MSTQLPQQPIMKTCKNTSRMALRCRKQLVELQEAEPTGACPYTEVLWKVIGH